MHISERMLLADAHTRVHSVDNAAIVGDITPHDGVSDADKFSLEAAAIQKMRETLGTSVMAGEAGTTLR